MASGKACLEYKAFLSHSDTLADILDTNQKALTKLHRKLRAKAWIEPAAELSTDQLVALVLKKIETDGKHIFEEFVDFMSDTAGLQDLATRMRGAQSRFFSLCHNVFHSCCEDTQSALHCL